jgi:hypothetical protein
LDPKWQKGFYRLAEVLYSSGEVQSAASVLKEGMRLSTKKQSQKPLQQLLVKCHDETAMMVELWAECRSVHATNFSDFKELVIEDLVPIIKGIHADRLTALLAACFDRPIFMPNSNSLPDCAMCALVEAR